MNEISEIIRRVIGRAPRETRSLSGGCVADVLRADFDDGPPVVVKRGAGDASIEAMMLDRLRAAGLPVPAVLGVEPGVLLLEWIDGGVHISGPGEAHAGRLLAGLHANAAREPGFEVDTLIGPLALPNTARASWSAFFAEQRVMHFAARAEHAGGIEAPLMNRIETLCGRMGSLIPEPDRFALLHGDIWSGNVIARACEGGAEIAAFIDPAVTYGDPEVELAFIDLFGTFGDRFYDAYAEHGGEVREDRVSRRGVYQLYPLLVHAALFGTSYGRQVEGVVRALGF